MKLIQIPLDSRPCNARFPAQLARLAGVEPLLPPQMDDFRTPADHRALRDFLRAEADAADGLVLSLDHWCFGSLIASRSADVSADEAMSRLDELEAILRAHPQMRGSAYSVVMRSSINTLNRDDLPHYQSMTEYSQQWHRCKLSGLPEDERRLQEIEASIPDEVLERYHTVRARNHAVNRRAVSLCRAGLLDKLLLLQEDAQPLGFHRVEQEALRREADGDGRIWLHNGTDEAGMLLVADAVRWDAPPLRVRVAYLRGDGSFVPAYEDRPFAENLRSHAGAAGIELAETCADCTLCVASPTAERQEDMANADAAPADAAADAERVLAEMRKGQPVALLDVRYANGGDGALLTALGPEALRGLAGYAAWNTACNSLGTVLAQLRASGGRRSPACDRFTRERLLDDYLYQGKVRRQINQELTAAGEDVLCLRDRAAAERLVQTRYQEALAQEPALPVDGEQVSVALPWPRTFEADIRIGGCR